jgi:hypothetical protein
LASTESDLPPECGSRAVFDREVMARLGTSPTTPVSVDITRVTSGYRLRVQVDDDIRELDDPSCAALFRAAVVVAVAMLMHDRSAPTSPVPSPPAAPPVPSPKPSVFPRFTLGAGVGVALRTLPHPVLALELETKLQWRLLGVSANVRYLAPTEKVDAQDKRVSLEAFGAGVTGFFRPSRSWEARLGFAAQRLSGKGAGSITQSHADTVWVAGPTLGLGFIPFQSPRAWAGLGAEAQLNAVRGSFQILHYSQDVTRPPHEIYPVPWLAASTFVRLGLVW